MVVFPPTSTSSPILTLPTCGTFVHVPALGSKPNASRGGNRGSWVAARSGARRGVHERGNAGVSQVRIGVDQCRYRTVSFVLGAHDDGGCPSGLQLPAVAGVREKTQGSRFRPRQR